MQHLQYNSPMKLYSTEAAEEQYQLHANQVPGQQNQPNIPLGHGHRQFDPTKSETLRAIQEDEYNNQPYNNQPYNNQPYDNQQFVNKQYYNNSVVDQQRAPQNQQSGWTGDVYERSERARSQTPNYQQKYYYGNDQFSGIPSSGPPQFTTDTPAGLVQIRYNSLPRPKKSEDTHHNPVQSGASERGYLYGGMDFVDHSRDSEFFNVNDDYNDWYQRRSRRDEEYQKYKHNYGVEYNSSPTRGFAYDENYRGYSANHPTKHWHYAADPCRPVNSYVSDIVECVDPVKLVGDTISNQKVPVEKFLTEEEKTNPGTPFAPPQGFRLDHRTVRPEPEEPGPICYSLSAKKHLARIDDNNQYAGRSQSAGPHSNRSQQSYGQNNTYGQNNVQNYGQGNAQNYGQNNSQGYSQANSQNYGQNNAQNYGQNNSQSYSQVSSQNYGQNTSYGQNNVQYNRTNVPVNAQQKPRKEVSLLTLVDDSAIQRQAHKVNTDVPPERPFNDWSEAVNQKRNVWEGRTGQSAYTRTHNERPAFWKKQPTQNQAGWQQQQNSQRQSSKYVQDTTDQDESQYNESYYQEQSQPQTQSSQQNFYYEEEQNKGNQVVQQPPQRTAPQSIQQTRPVQNQQTQQSNVNRQTVQQQRTTTTTNYQTQQPQQPQQSYSYTQSGNAPVQKPATQVLEYNTYTRHVNQPDSQAAPDFAGNRPQPPSQNQQQQFRVQAKPNVQSTQQQSSQQVDHFTYYPQEQEPGDFHRPGIPQQQVPQRQVQPQQQTNFPPQQVKTPPAVPPKPQTNNQQVKPAPNQQQFQQPTNNQNYNQFYYKETVQENGGPPRVTSYSSQNPGDFSRFSEMQERLPSGKLANTFSQSHRQYQDPSGQNVEYSYELTTSTDPDYEAELLKEEERRVTEQELEPGVISRNVTTKYYKKKVVTDQDTTTFS